MRNVLLVGQPQGPNAENLPPDVYAGPEKVLDADGDMATTLTPSVADDGKPSGKLAYPRARSTKVGFSKAGTYVLKLTADDGQLEGSHTVRIIVSNQSKEDN